MRRIDVIHKELERLTYGLELSDLAKEKAFTAEAIGFNLGLARNSVSKDLNQLWNEGPVVKSQGRPVFLHRHALELLINRKLDDCECIVHSVASLLPKKEKYTDDDPFSGLIGYDRSLRDAVEKAAQRCFIPTDYMCC